MDIQALEKKYQNLYAPTFKILVEGKNIIQEGVEVIAVNIDNTLDGADTFSFTVFNAFDLTKREIFWFDSLFKFGEKVEIKLGYAKEIIKTLMIGLITSVQVTKVSVRKAKSGDQNIITLVRPETDLVFLTLLFL